MNHDSNSGLFRGTSSFVTYSELGGTTVPIPLICSRLSSLPLDGILGFLAHLSLEITHMGIKITDPRWQAPYLNMALVDDFPESLPNVSRYLAPGRVPLTGGRHVFIHNQNIAVLAHLSLLHCDTSAFTPNLSTDLKRSACRLLVLVNDHLSREVPDTTSPTMMLRREFCTEWLRHYQFGIDTPFLNRAAHSIARQHKLYALTESNEFYGVEAAFRNATFGTTLDELFQFLALLHATVAQKLKPGVVWLPRGLMHTPTRVGARIVDAFTKKWVRTPLEYRARFKAITSPDSCQTGREHLDLQCLRESPLIAAREDSVICPYFPFMRDLIPDSPYFLILDSLVDGKDKSRFQTGLGQGFAEYVAELLARIAVGDCRGTWELQSRVLSKKRGKELADSILWRGQVAIVFEHKGQRPGTRFLSGMASELVLGPSDEILNMIEAGQAPNLVRAKRGDHGLLTHGIWQQALNGPEALSWIQEQMGRAPSKVYPMHLSLYEPRMDSIVRGVYIEPLLAAAGLYKGDTWASPQWLLITDLEALAALADEGRLDLEAILMYKENNTNSRLERFDIFLDSLIERIPIDRKLADHGMDLFRRAGVFFREDE